MAKIIYKSPGYKIQGKFKNMVFKSINGKDYIASLPSKRSSEPSYKELLTRKIFGLTAVVSKSIAKAACAEETWGKHCRGNSVYNVVFKTVHIHITGKSNDLNYQGPQCFSLPKCDLTDFVSIYPRIGSSFINPSDVEVTYDLISVVYSKSDFLEDKTEVPAFMRITAVIICEYPNVEKVKEIVGFTWNSEPLTFSNEGKIEVKLLLNEYKGEYYGNPENDLSNCCLYDKHTVLIAAAFLDKDLKYYGHTFTNIFRTEFNKV